MPLQVFDNSADAKLRELEMRIGEIESSLNVVPIHIAKPSEVGLEMVEIRETFIGNEKQTVQVRNVKVKEGVPEPLEEGEMPPEEPLETPDSHEPDPDDEPYSARTLFCQGLYRINDTAVIARILPTGDAYIISAGRIYIAGLVTGQNMGNEGDPDGAPGSFKIDPIGPIEPEKDVHVGWPPPDPPPANEEGVVDDTVQVAMAYGSPFIGEGEENQEVEGQDAFRGILYAHGRGGEFDPESGSPRFPRAELHMVAAPCDAVINWASSYILPTIPPPPP